MKRVSSRFLVLVLMLLTIFGVKSIGTAEVGNDMVTPYYSYTVKVTASLIIDEYGAATCKGSIRVRSNDSSVSIVVQLQKKSGSTWMPVKTWYGNSDGGKYLISLSNSHTLSPGTYRVYVDGLVTDIDGNSEVVAAVSGERTHS